MPGPATTGGSASQQVGDLLATTPGNWMMGPGIPHARWTRAPGTSDDLFFTGTPDGNVNCVIPVGVSTVVPSASGTPPQAPPQNTYAGIRTVNGYSQAVILQKSLAVGTLQVTSGMIRQDDQSTITSSGASGGLPFTNSATAYAGNLWITSSLNWTGGTLNDNSVGGGIFLGPQATGTAEASAAANYTLNLGSSLTLLGTGTGQGGTMSVIGGTLNFAGVITAGDDSNLRLICAPVPRAEGRADPEMHLRGKNNLDERGSGIIHVSATGTLTVTSTRPPGKDGLGTATLTGAAGKPAAVVNEGYTDINDHTKLLIQGGAVENLVPDGQFIQRKGDLPPAQRVIPLGTRLETDSSIVCEGKNGVVDIQAGFFKVDTRFFGLNPVGDSTATIKTDSVFLGESATLDLVSASRFVTFNVSSKFLILDGTINQSISRNSNESDHIVTIADVIIDKDKMMLNLTWGNPGVALTGDRWSLIEIDSLADASAVSKIPTAARTTKPANTTVKLRDSWKEIYLERD